MIDQYTENVDTSLPMVFRKTMAAQYETESRASAVMGNTISVIIALVVCTPILLAFAVLIPLLCFKNLEKQSIVERLRTE